MKKVLFVCTGNTCRSPMAAAVFTRLLEENKIQGVTADSAGLAAVAGAGASENAMRAIAETGGDLSGHRAKLATKELLEGSDSIYVMSSSHMAAILHAFPHLKDKIGVLGGGVPDPFGGDLQAYRVCRDAITAALERIVGNDFA